MERYVNYRQKDDSEQTAAAVPLFLYGSAIVWYDTLTEIVRGNTNRLKEEFMTFFCPSALNHLLYNESIFTRTQRPAKRAHDYNSTVQKLASRLPALYKGILKCKILRGLQPQVKAFCLQQATETINDIIAAAKIAETADVAAADRNISELSEIRGEIRASRLASYCCS